MKTSYPRIRLGDICAWFGLTRQAHYAYKNRRRDRLIEYQMVLEKVAEIRKDHSRIGGRKLHQKLQPFLAQHEIKLGRDALFDLLAANGLLIRKRKRKVRTTQSNHRYKKYPNQIKNFIPTAPNQLWVSDITYWDIAGKFAYLSLITDAYSHMIVGYTLSENLKAIGPLTSLRQALARLDQPPEGLIHHSDRGIQYCCDAYTGLLGKNHITISMTEDGDPRENAIAERINGILKHEYLYTQSVDNFEQARRVLDRAIWLYNTDRPHMSIGNMTPHEVHHGNHQIAPIQLWKNYYHKKDFPNQDV